MTQQLISFNIAPCVDTAFDYMRDAVERGAISGDGLYTKKCNAWMEDRFGAQKVMLTTSGTSALEMAAWLCDLEPGDEVILPSYTFSSTANAFVLAGARLVFVDVRPDTMNIDEKKIEAAITDRTRVICVVHYAGVSCEMDTIMDIAARHNLKVVEDAAQGVCSAYKGRALGTIGDIGCYSFHETKNFSMGEGGAIVIQNEADNLKAEIIREKGTNRSQFFRGQVDKYTWQAWGSSYLPSDLNAAYLWAQLEVADEITASRMATWNAYYEAFTPLAEQGLLELPSVPAECVQNAHMFYCKLPDLAARTAFIKHCKEQGVQCVFHYVPLHSAPAGLRFGRFAGEDEFTTRESDRLVRLPLYYNMDPADRDRVIAAVLSFWSDRG